MHRWKRHFVPTKNSKFYPKFRPGRNNTRFTSSIPKCNRSHQHKLSDSSVQPGTVWFHGQAQTIARSRHCLAHQLVYVIRCKLQRKSRHAVQMYFLAVALTLKLITPPGWGLLGAIPGWDTRSKLELGILGSRSNTIKL